MTDKDLRRAYYPDYFSIDNILACQTLIQCRTEMSIPKFGFLVQDCNSDDLPAGMDLQLPLWAARVLCRPGQKYISVNIPPGFKEAHRQVIDDQPTVADLKKVHSQYFEAGHLCTSLFHNEAGELAEMLPEILQQRILCIGETTISNPRSIWVQHTTLSNNKSIPPEYLDKLEDKIFTDSKKGSDAIQQWLEPLDRPLDFEITRSQKPVPPQPTAHNYPPAAHQVQGQQYAAPTANLHSQHYAQNYQQPGNFHPHPGLPSVPAAHSNSNYHTQHHYHQNNMR